MSEVVRMLWVGHWWEAATGIFAIGVIMWLTEPDHVTPLLLSDDGAWKQCYQLDPHPEHGWIDEGDKARRCAGVIALRKDLGSEWHGIDG